MKSFKVLAATYTAEVSLGKIPNPYWLQGWMGMKGKWIVCMCYTFLVKDRVVYFGKEVLGLLR